MAGIFSGFEKLGLGNLGEENLFEDPRKKEVAVKKEEPKSPEKDKQVTLALIEIIEQKRKKFLQR